MELINCKPKEHIKIDPKTKLEEIILKAENIIKKDNFNSLLISAVGGSIQNLVNVVEILKYSFPGLFQQNKISTVAYVPKDERENTKIEHLYPKMETILYLKKPEIQNEEGFQEPINEEERLQFLKVYQENLNQNVKSDGLNKQNSKKEIDFLKYKRRISKLLGLEKEKNANEKFKTTPAKVFKCLIVFLFLVCIVLPIVIALFSFFLVFSLSGMTYLGGTSLNDLTIKNKKVKLFFDLTNYATLFLLGAALWSLGYITLAILIIVLPIYLIYRLCRKNPDEEMEIS